MKKFKRKKILGICKFCGRIARYRFKNGSLCCCNHQSKCPVISKDHAEKMKGKKHTKETKEKIAANNRKRIYSKETREKIGKKHRGKTISLETRQKTSNTLKGRIFTKSHRKKISQALTGIIRPKGRKCPEQSERMKNGLAAYANSFIRNPSKPQVELYNLIKLLYPSAILNYPSLNFSIDIAILDSMIAIEYDGSYWHDKEKDKIRQQKLENIGWKFLRYMDRIPSVNELKRDLQQI